MWILTYKSNYNPERLNFFNLAGTLCELSEPEPFNCFECINTLLNQPEEPLEAYFWVEPQSVSLWNSNRTEAAKYGGGLKIHNPVFKHFCT
jgi:hypothetical protein